MQFNQERIVFAITIVLFATFCLTLDQFATPGNLISLLQSVAILGVLGIGMALVVIGRGIDLTMVTIMAISVGWVFNEINTGLSVGAAFGLGFGFAILIGLINGILIAYVEIPGHFRYFGNGYGHLWSRPFCLGRQRYDLRRRSPVVVQATRRWIRRRDSGIGHLDRADRVPGVPVSAPDQDRSLSLCDG